MEKKEKGWFSCLLSYTEGSRGKLAGSVALSVISVVSGLAPYYCVYKLIESFLEGRLSGCGDLVLVRLGFVCICGESGLLRLIHRAVPLCGLSYSGTA